MSEMLLPVITTTATGREGYHEDLVLPALTLTASGSAGSGVVDTAEQRLPSLTVTAEGYGGSTTQPWRPHDISLPTLEVLGTGGNGIILPLLDCTGTGETGNVFEHDETLPVLTTSGTGFGGETGTADFTLPALEVAGGNGIGLIADLPALDVTASGYGGTLGRTVLPLDLPALDATGSGYFSTRGTATLALPVLATVGAGHETVIARSDVTLPTITLTASGGNGTVGTATLTLPVLTVLAAGYGAVSGTATIVLPVLEASGDGHTPSAAAAFFGVALNTHTRAASTYAGLPFNSLASFQGVVLGAMDGGLYALDADTDAGGDIDARIVAAITDFGAEHLKRVTYAYLGIAADGELELAVRCDEGATYFYRTGPASTANLGALRVKIGRGLKGRYWQWELANVDGGDFRLDALTLHPQLTSRRV